LHDNFALIIWYERSNALLPPRNQTAMTKVPGPSVLEARRQATLGSAAAKQAHDLSAKDKDMFVKYLHRCDYRATELTQDIDHSLVEAIKVVIS
jgi:hypothetical protein